MCAVAYWPFGVSIPERVWGGLEPASSFSIEVLKPVFQSLRGFGVGWSVSVVMAQSSRVVVSIPERVWGGLEPERTLPCNSEG